LTKIEDESQIIQQLLCGKKEMYELVVKKYGEDNVLGRSSFYKLLQSSQFKKQKQLTALCDQCSKYGFGTSFSIG